MPLLSVVIPVRGKWDLTRDCLRGLAAHGPSGLFEVIVVDNASADATPAECPGLGRDLFGRNFRFLRQESNVNFGPACNLGAEAAGGSLLFFLNNDTLVTPGWLPPLLEAAALPGTAGVGPLLAYPDDSVQHLGIAINPAGDKLGHLYARLPVAHRLARKARVFPAITAAALLLPAARFREAGGFYPEFVNGFEDVDLCLRLTSGGDVMRVVPESRVYHLESQTPKRHDADLSNSRLLTSRWNLADFTNLEAVAAEDGYVLAVEPRLDIRLTPHPSRLPGLLKGMRGPRGIDLQAAWDTLADEPYWEEGYAMLGQALEGAGLREEAFRIAYHGLLMNPTLAGHERLLRAARALDGSRDLAEEIRELEASFAREKERILDEAGHAARLETILAVLRGKGKSSLAARYGEAAALAARLRQAWRAE